MNSGIEKQTSKFYYPCSPLKDGALMKSDVQSLTVIMYLLGDSLNCFRNRQMIKRNFYYLHTGCLILKWFFRRTPVSKPLDILTKSAVFFRFYALKFSLQFFKKCFPFIIEPKKQIFRKINIKNIFQIFLKKFH